MDEPGSDTWVTWETGAREMGVTKGVFFYEVRQGRVIENANRPEKDGKYLLSSILERKRERETRKRKPYKRERSPQIKYGWILPGDLLKVLELDQERYSETAKEYEINYQEAAEYQAQYKKNDRLAMAAWSIDRQECLGYISLIPVAEQVALAIMAGQRDESSLTIDKIETYKRPGGYVLLCRSVVTKKDHQFVLTGILKGILNYWIEQFPLRYVTRVYAQTASAEGLRLLRHLFLMPMAGYPDNAYYLDFARANPSKLIQNFLASLEAKAPLPDALTERFTPPLPPTHRHTRVRPSLPHPGNESRHTGEGLPDDLVPVESFRLLHGIGKGTVQKAIEAGRLTPRINDWKQGRAWVKYALDAAGRARFYELWHHLPAWQNCPDCPHSIE